MKKILLVIGLVLLLNLSLASAATQQELTEAKNLIDSKADCKSLSNSQLEIIGEYEMEQMHPGQSHEAMHAMMGFKEGDNQEQQFHINLAKSMYCGDSSAMSGGMDMSNMQMDMMDDNPLESKFESSFGKTMNLFSAVFLVGLTVLVYLGIYKLWRWEPKNKKDSGHNNGEN
jgi:hypothetical protein